MKPNEQGTASETVAKTQDAVNVVGYADRFSVQPGQALNFMIDTASSSYTASVVRICGGMPDPDHSPYLPTEPVPADCAGEYPGRRQTAAIGSYAELPLPEEWMQAGNFRFRCGCTRRFRNMRRRRRSGLPNLPTVQPGRM